MLTQKDFLLTILFSRNTTKVICFLLVILSVVQSQASTCNTETSPDILYCSPAVGEVYKIGDIVTLSWNPVNNLFFGTDFERQVEIYLFRRRQNASTVEDPVMLNPPDYNITTSITAGNPSNNTVEYSWLPTTLSNNEKYTFVFRVIPKGTAGINMNNGVYSTNVFTVLGPVKNLTTSTTSTSTPTPSPTPSPETDLPSINSGVSKPSKSDNALIVVSGIALFLAFIAVVIAIRNRKFANNKTKHRSLSNLSVTSSTPIITSLKFGGNNRDTAGGESIHSTTPLANKEEMRSKPKSSVSFSSENQPISASDAAFLSDAFRKGLRKPDWKPEDEEDDDPNLSQEERLRRREAKELMKKELAEEGTDLQNIARHTKVEIRNISDELEKDGASHSSKSGSK